MNPKFNVGEMVTVKGEIIGIQSVNSNSVSPDFYYAIDIGDNAVVQVHERFVYKNIKLENIKTHDAKEYKKNHFK